MNSNNFKPFNIKKCKFPKCENVGTRKSCLRNGLCNKHRKWAEKGIIDRETCEIIKPDKLPKQKEWYHCKISGCLKKHKAKGFCSNHYRSFLIYKTIDSKGNYIGKKRKYDKFSKCQVIGCCKKKPLIKGMCKFHSGQIQKGILNQDGFKIRELKKVPKYSENDKCKIPQCKNKPSLNWMCRSCNEKVRKKTMLETGQLLVKARFKNINKKCSKKNCDGIAHCKGLCKTHYSREQYIYKKEIKLAAKFNNDILT
jgi:hypothetical protein